MSSVTWFTIAYQHHNTHIFTIIDQLNMNDTIKYIMYIGSLPWVLSWIWPSLRYSHCSLFLVHCSLSSSTPSIRFSVWLLLSSSLNVLLVVFSQFMIIVSNTVTDMLINRRLERHLPRVLLVHCLGPK